MCFFFQICVFCKYFLRFCDLFIHSLNSIFQSVEDFKFELLTICTINYVKNVV